MTGVNLWSITAANNVSANIGYTWNEGMAPAAVNNSARAVLADVRAMANDLIWFLYGKGDGPYSPVYVASTQFKIAGVDVTIPYHVGRRVKAVGSGTGTIYGSISAVSFSTDTTVTVVWDSGSLTNEALLIYLSQVPVTGSPVPAEAVAGTATGTFTPTDASGATLTLVSPVGFYRKHAGFVHVWGSFTYPSTGDGSSTKIGGLPFTSANLATHLSGFAGNVTFGGGMGDPGGNKINTLNVIKNSTTLEFRFGGGSSLTNASASGFAVDFYACYPI